MPQHIRARGWLVPAVALLTLAACNDATPSASPRPSAPREWSATQGKETGAPTPGTPAQQAPNQGGEAPADARRSR